MFEKILVAAFILFCIFMMDPPTVSANCKIKIQGGGTIKADRCWKKDNMVYFSKSGLEAGIQESVVLNISGYIETNSASSQASNKSSYRKNSSKNPVGKKAGGPQKGHSETASIDKNKLDKIMEQVENLKKAYKILDKKPEDF